MENWYVVVCNLVYPLLLVGEYVDVALIVLLLMSVVGVAIAANIQTHRLNRVALACYPVLFHLCFILFRLTTVNVVVVYTQMVALTILLFGSVHHFLFMLYGLLKTTIQLCRRSKAEVHIQTQKTKNV